MLEGEGEAHTCAIVEEMGAGRVRCWGRGTSGVLGVQSPNNIGDTPGTATAGGGSLPALPQKLLRFAAPRVASCNAAIPHNSCFRVVERLPQQIAPALALLVAAWAAASVQNVGFVIGSS